MLLRSSFTIILFLIFGLLNYSHCQLIPINLEDKIEQSQIVVEAEVVYSKSYLGSDNHIYTAHTLSVSRIWNSEFTNKLTIITRGGIFESLREHWSHIIQLKNGEKGIFFLIPTTLPKKSDFNLDHQQYEIYASSQGFINYKTLNIEWKTGIILKNGQKSKQELLSILRKAFGNEKLPAISVKETEDCIIYRFEPASETNLSEVLKLAVDINVKLSNGKKNLYQSLAIIEYDSTFFGTNIVANGNLSLEDGLISSFSGYDLTATDITSNKIELKVIANQTSNLHELGTTESWLTRLILEIENPLGSPTFNLDETAMIAGNQYYDPESSETNTFECIEIIDEISEDICPIITNFSPTSMSAGTGDTLTVIGEKFGSSSDNVTPPAGSSLLLRKVTQTGENGVLDWVIPWVTEYTLWTDTLIRAIIPGTGIQLSDANFVDSPGTGLVGVLRDGCIDSTNVNLRIDFATNDLAVNHPVTGLPLNLPIYLASKNGLGGYDLVYDSTFINFDSMAVYAFNRALETWRCATGVNFNIQNFDSIPVQFQADACRISYDLMPAGVPSTVIAYTNLDDLGFCGSGGVATYGFLRNFELIFSNSITWQTSSGMPGIDFQDTIDLETVALHELGHGHQLLHTNNLNNTLYHEVDSYDRSLDSDDIDGGKYIVEVSSNELLTCSAAPVMIPVPFSECTDILDGIISLNSEELSIHIYPNPAIEFLMIEFEASLQLKNRNLKLAIYSPLGSLLYHQEIYKEKEKIDIQNLAKGVMFGILTSEGHILDSFKFFKL